MTTELSVDYWEHKISISIPGDVTLGQIAVPSAIKDTEKAASEAVLSPVGAEPLPELARKAKNGRVVIAFDDPFRPEVPRRSIIKVLLEELTKAGVKDENIILLCAGGMHPKRTPVQLRKYLGNEIFDRFHSNGTASRVFNHDCCDPDGVIYMGTSEMGDYVEHNRLLCDSDLFIYTGTVRPMLWGGLSGTGVVVGLSSERAMSSTHGFPVIGHPDSCHGDHSTSYFRAHKEAIMKQIEQFCNKRVFYVDFLLGGPEETLGVFAGYSPEINEPVWELAEKIYRIEVPQADVFITGIPRYILYGESRNPLISLAAAASSFRSWINKPLIRDGGVVIALTYCDGVIDDRLHTSYRELIELYGSCFSAEELSLFEEEFRNRKDLIDKYRYAYGYAPTHPFWLFYESQYMLDTASKVIFAGIPGMDNSMCKGGLVRNTKGQEAIRKIGGVPAKDFDHAWKLAEQIVGKNPKILACPEYWSNLPPQFLVK